jgi:hypothetical protein
MIFRCSKCGCHDDSAVGHYWSARLRDAAPLCSVCDPKIHKWHNEFPRIFGTFLVPPVEEPRSDLPTLLERLWRTDLALDPLLAQPRQSADAPAKAPDPPFDRSDPIPSYWPRTVGTGGW